MQINTQQVTRETNDAVLEHIMKEGFIRLLQPTEQELFSEYIAYESSLNRVSDLSLRLEKVKDTAQKNTVFGLYLMQPVKDRIAHIVEKLEAQRQEQERVNTHQDIPLKKSGIYDRMKIERMLPIINIDGKYYAVSLGRIADRFIKIVAGDAVVINFKQLEEIVALQEAQNRQPFKAPSGRSKSFFGVGGGFASRGGVASTREDVGYRQTIADDSGMRLGNDDSRSPSSLYSSSSSSSWDSGGGGGFSGGGATDD